jgi:Cytochrome P460
MTNKLLLAAVFLLVAFGGLTEDRAPSSAAPEYTAEGQLKFPEHYREWIYLSTGIDMSYTPGMNMAHHLFDNVFANPAAYKKFQETGSWPDKTMLLLEVRGAETKGSINQQGSFQNEQIMGVEVHIKDEAKFPGKWAFFAFDDGRVGNLFPAAAACYSCHQAHGAVDTTFVQFYPTLFPLARSKGTLSAAYLKESGQTK